MTEDETRWYPRLFVNEQMFQTPIPSPQNARNPCDKDNGARSAHFGEPFDELDDAPSFLDGKTDAFFFRVYNGRREDSLQSPVEYDQQISTNLSSRWTIHTALLV